MVTQSAESHAVRHGDAVLRLEREPAPASPAPTRLAPADSLTTAALGHIRELTGVSGVVLLRLLEPRPDSEVVIAGRVGSIPGKVYRALYAWYRRTYPETVQIVLSEAQHEAGPGLGGLESLAVLPIHAADGARWGGFLLAADTQPRELVPLALVLAQIIARLLLVQYEYEHVGHAEGARLAGRTAQHELNNALGKVQLRAELLSYDPSLPAALQDHAEQVRRAVQRIVQEVRTSISDASGINPRARTAHDHD